MKNFIWGFICGIIISYVILNFGQIKYKFTNIYRSSSTEFKQQTPPPPKKAVPPSKKTTPGTAAKNPQRKKKLAPLFQDIPKQIVTTTTEKPATKTTVTPDTTSNQEPVTSLPGLLPTLRKKKRLDYTREYKISDEEQTLYQKYQQINWDYEQKTSGQLLSMAEMKKFKYDFEQQLEQLAAEYGISVAQLSEVEKYMKKILK